VTSPPPLLLAHEIFPLIADLQWGIGGSLLLYHLGLPAEPRDLDIVSTLEDFGQINTRLALALGPPTPAPHPSYVSIGFSRFLAGSGVSLDLMAGVRVRTTEGSCVDWHFDPQTVTYAEGLPWMQATDWVDLYTIFNRPEQVDILKKCIADGDAS
jgi:hypothetical protein